jgi:protein-S-isoprenylcysteine O-methyltransferase Ste14
MASPAARNVRRDEVIEILLNTNIVSGLKVLNKRVDEYKTCGILPQMPFQATDFEFRNRFWMFGAVMGLGFACYILDPTNAAVALGGGDDTRVRSLFALGAVLNGLAAWIRSWATGYLQSSVVHDPSLHSDHLMADGPYRYVRNPLYLGNILMALGLGLLASRIGFIVIAAGVLFVNYRLIGREEAELLASQGESYRRYLAAVPRLLPSLTPRVPSGGGHANWRDGLIAEIFFWGFMLGMAVFAVTLNLRDFWIVSSAGFAIYFFWGWRTGRFK